MCGQLVLENYKLKRCIRCKACDLSKNARCALLCFKPLKLPKFLFQQKGYTKQQNLTNNVSENFGHFYSKEILKFCILIARRNHFSE